jgi:hypothetical protein
VPHFDEKTIDQSKRQADEVSRNGEMTTAALLMHYMNVQVKSFKNNTLRLIFNVKYQTTLSAQPTAEHLVVIFYMHL